MDILFYWLDKVRYDKKIKIISSTNFDKCYEYNVIKYPSNLPDVWQIDKKYLKEKTEYNS